MAGHSVQRTACFRTPMARPSTSSREGHLSGVDARHGPGMTGDRVSEIPQHLAPNGDHSDEQRQGGERGSFLNYGFEHEHLSRNKERT
jgi:hypothetical protein